MMEKAQHLLLGCMEAKDVEPSNHVICYASYLKSNKKISGMGELGMDSRPFPAPLPHGIPVPFPPPPVSRLRTSFTHFFNSIFTYSNDLMGYSQLKSKTVCTVCTAK